MRHELADALAGWRRRAMLWMVASGVRRSIEAAADDAVRTAEQLVVGAWIAELHSAAHDADAAVRACLHLRAAAVSDLRSAQLAGDPQRIVDAQWVLESVERDLADSESTREGVGALLARELADQPSASQVRVLPDRHAAAL